MSTTGETLSQLLQDAVKGAGTDLKVSGQQLADYIDQRVAALALASGEPGYDGTVQAARDNVALYAAAIAVDSADANDQRILGMIHGALAVGVALA